MLDKSFKEKYGPWAVLIGAAEGIGEAYSISLAKRGMNVLMVDKSNHSLLKLAEKIAQEYGVKTKSIALDLYEEEAVSIIINEVEKMNCSLLIYNAAYSKVKAFVDLDEMEIDHFTKINSDSQIKVVHQFSKYLVDKNKSGGILLMSSLAGLIGVQLVSTYAATKALTWNLAEALHYE